MKLDRNTNRGGHGKYALVNMRKLVPIIDRRENIGQLALSGKEAGLLAAFELLVTAGVISLGNETPGDQFFVLKYKDRFTADGLRAYAVSVMQAAETRGDASLREYAVQMLIEADSAEMLGNRIPD